MNNKSRYTCILVTGTDEKLIHILIDEGIEDKDGVVQPNVLVEYEGVKYILTRPYSKKVFIYKPCDSVIKDE